MLSYSGTRKTSNECRVSNGDAENARHENAGLENAAQTYTGWKMRDWKMWHKNAEGGKCRNGKSGKRKV